MIVTEQKVINIMLGGLTNVWYKQNTDNVSCLERMNYRTKLQREVNLKVSAELWLDGKIRVKIH